MSSWRRKAGRPEFGAGVRGVSVGELSAFAGDHGPWSSFPPSPGSAQGLVTDKVTGLVRGRDQLEVCLMPRPLLSYQPT